MRVFISWSGEQSKSAAEVLREWIPNVLQSVEPFISSQDIDTGVPWFNEIKRALDETRFGIVCLTKANCSSPWLLYEIGALAHRVEHPNVVPILLDLGPRDLPTPISFFQAIEVNQKAFLRLVESLNSHLGDASLPEGRLRTAFDKWWPDLESQLSSIAKDPVKDDADKQTPLEEQNNLDESINEILELVRGVSVKTDSIDRSLKTKRDEGGQTKGYGLRIPEDIDGKRTAVGLAYENALTDEEIEKISKWGKSASGQAKESNLERLTKNIEYFINAMEKVEKPAQSHDKKKATSKKAGGQTVDRSKDDKPKK